MARLAGIPGTIGDEAKAIRWYRVPDHAGCRRYRADVTDGFLMAMVGHERSRTGT
jgi:hypothetical protein